MKKFISVDNRVIFNKENLLKVELDDNGDISSIFLCFFDEDNEECIIFDSAEDEEDEEDE